MNTLLIILGLFVSAYSQTIVDLAVGDSRLTTLVQALTEAGLVDVLNGAGPFTVFAPTDDAFAAIEVPTNVTVLSNILQYHVLSAQVLSTDLSSGLVADTLISQPITVQIGDMVSIYDTMGRKANVTEADIQGTNGVIHIIDNVILPDGTIADVTSNIASLSTLNGALAANSLDTVLSGDGPYTVFAPTDDAVAAFAGTIDSELLLYHVLGAEYKSGDIPDGETVLVTADTAGDEVTVIKDDTGVYVKDAVGRIATVTMANFATNNGVVHIIDIVLASSEFGTVVDLAVEDPRLTSLVGALTSAGLVSTLSGAGTFTVFAPTDDAVAAFGNSITSEVLLYHVLGTEYLSGAIPDGNTTLPTLNTDTDDVIVMKNDNGVFVKDRLGRIATVTQADLQGTNGVIHIIDIVLEYRDIVDFAIEDSRLTELVQALTDANLVSALQAPNGPFTVFAPTDDAFDAITVPSDTTELANILTYHVVSGEVLSTDLYPGLIAETLQTESITVQTANGPSIYDSMGMIAQVTDADIVGANGVIHIIDAVLLPGGDIVDIVSNTDSLSSLAGALTEKGLISTLEGDGPYTVFAPTNDAIAAFGGVIDTELLLYHVLSGEFLNDAILLTGDDFTNIPTGSTVLGTANTDGDEVTVIKNDTGVFVQDALGRVATVTLANIAGTNGVVHIIDVVLATPTIVNLAVFDSRLTTLVGALATAGLVDVLSGDGPFTVFAPTNDAFDAITVPENVTVLSKVLQYHVLAGEVPSSALSSGLVATTIIDQTITCQIDNGVFFYDSNGRASQVTKADITATNGVIHIVDSVLLPDGTLADITSNVDILSSLNGALVDTGLDETLSGEGTFTVFAPTNDAVAAFVAEGGEITTDVLLYHVLASQFFSGDIPDGETVLATANTDGDEVTVINNATGIFVKDAIDRIATVTLANIAGTNGVAHVIDIVLSPTELETPEPTVDESGVNRMSISVFCITFYFLAFLIFT